MKSTKKIIAEAKKQSPMKARRTDDGQEYYSYYEFPILGFDEFVRTLLESFGEEIIKTRYKCGWRHDEEGAEYDLCDECRAVDEYKAEQRLKVKDIINSIGK